MQPTSLPNRQILYALQRHALGVTPIIHRTVELVAQRRHVLQNAQKSPGPMSVVKDFLLTCLNGFGGVAFAYASYQPEPETKPNILATQNFITGDDMRCGMLMVIDARNIDVDALNLTDPQMADLYSCLYGKNGDSLYIKIRDEGMHGLHPAPAQNRAQKTVLTNTSL